MCFIKPHLSFYGIRFHIFPHISIVIQRIAKEKTTELASKFKAVAVTGARQTGKTTLVKQIFKGKPYVSLENPDNRSFAL